MGTPCPIVLVNLLSHPQTNTEGSLRDKQLSVDVCARDFPPLLVDKHAFFCMSLMDAISLLEVFQRWLVVRRCLIPPPLPVVDKQFSQGGTHQALLLCLCVNKNMGFFFFLTTVAFVINEFMNRMHNRWFCREGITYSWCLCVDGLGEDGWWFYCSVNTLRDKMSPAEKTKVNWNGRTRHLFNFPTSGLLQIKSIFNKSQGQLAFGEVDV